MHSESTLIGRLGAAPRLHTDPTKKTFATFSVATHRYARDEQGKAAKLTTWHEVVAWEKTAEDLAGLLHKGSLVWVRGRLEYRDWEDRNGRRHRTAEVHLAEWKRLDRAPGAAEASDDFAAGPETAAPAASPEPQAGSEVGSEPRGRKRPAAR